LSLHDADAPLGSWFGKKENQNTTSSLLQEDETSFGFASGLDSHCSWFEPCTGFWLRFSLILVEKGLIVFVLAGYFDESGAPARRFSRITPLSSALDKPMSATRRGPVLQNCNSLVAGF
jgi:hypothetical protein